jgi:hypothetical protein
MSTGFWVKQVVDAVRSHNAGALVARMDLLDASALTCLQSGQFSASELHEISLNNFEGARVENADKWAVLATEHLMSLQRFRGGKHLVRSATPRDLLR